MEKSPRRDYSRGQMSRAPGEAARRLRVWIKLASFPAALLAICWSEGDI